MTGQFGKNHFGDLNKYLPCLHGFDEFYGYLYHLRRHGRSILAFLSRRAEKTRWDHVIWCTAGPRQLLMPLVMPRWGVVGKQKITDEGTLPPERMKTVDDEILKKYFCLYG